MANRRASTGAHSWLRARPNRNSPHGITCGCVTEFLNHQELAMMDVIVLAIGLGFFALSVGYVYVCERL